METLVDVLIRRGASHPDRVACRLIGEGGAEADRLTYGELDERARAIAAWLQSRRVASEPILVMYPSSLEYIVALLGCLYAGAIAVPAFPARSNRTRARLSRIAEDAGARLLFAPAGGVEGAAAAAVEACAVANVDSDLATRWRRPDVAGDTLALLQYTSGSTSDPKGVMVSHDNLVHAERLIQSAFGTTEESIVLGWLPMYHDMGLIGMVLQPLYAGATTIVMPPSLFLHRPLTWLEAIGRYRATISGGPNSAFDLCVERIAEEDRAHLDLGSWQVAFNGAEPVRKATLDRFVEAFGRYGFAPGSFRPCYGLAEATLLASAAPARPQAVARLLDAGELEVNRARDAESCARGARWMVSCGTPAADDSVCIVDAAGDVLPEGEIGEIWVTGPQVAQGYWNRPEETAAVFGARVRHRAVPYLRTGDLGFLRGGDLFVAGRVKDLIIIRGQNHYPSDIEQTVASSYPTLHHRAGAAFAVDVCGEERVVVVHETGPLAAETSDRAIAAVRQSVGQEHGVPLAAVVLVAPHAIPTTSSSKVRRAECRKQFMNGRLEVVAEWRAPEVEGSSDIAQKSAQEEVAAWLRSYVAARLAWRASDIRLDRPLVEYGLDSLEAVRLTQAIGARFGVVVEPTSLLEDGTLAQLSERLLAERSQMQPSAAVEPPPPEFALSYGQQAQWLHEQAEGVHATYNIAHAARIHGPLNVTALRNAIVRLVERHAMLRSTFSAEAGTPRHRIGSTAAESFAEIDASTWDEATLRRWLNHEARRTFDLERGPLLRVHVVQTREGPVLQVVIHHLIADLWSLAVLLQDLGAIYAAENDGRPVVLPPVGAHYHRFVEQERLAVETHGETAWEYWRSHLRGPLPMLNLGRLRARVSPATYLSGVEPFELDEATTDGLRTLGRENGATLYMTLLALFQILLSRHTAQSDVIVGSPVAGRSRSEFELTIGYFVKTLPIRGDLAGDPTVAEYLQRVRRAVLGAFRHQEYPFRLLVERLQPARLRGVPPVFQAMFILQQALERDSLLAALAIGHGGVRFSIGELQLESIALEDRVSNFPLTLTTAHTGGRIVGSFEYQLDVLDADCARRMVAHLRALAESAAANPTLRVSELRMLTTEEQRRAVIDWNATAVEWPVDRPLHEHVEAQGRRTPDAVAAVDDQQQITYSQLNDRSDALARHLRTMRVRPDHPVGVCLERSVDLVIAILAVVKAGGAYLPIDPGEPSHRVDGQLDDAGVSVILTTRAHAGSLPPRRSRRFVCVDEPLPPRSRAPRDEPNAKVDGGNLAYVIYTSGSTGRPKGVMNAHGAVCNRLLWMQARYRLQSRDRVLQKTPYTFDVSVWEFFWPLMCGSTLVVARPGGHQDPTYLVDQIVREQITVAHFVPSMLKAFLQHPRAHTCISLRDVISSGEALDAETQRLWFSCLRAGLHNLYGPTEAAIDVSHWTCASDQHDPVVPIGRPIANTQLYILDSGMQVVPVGVPGEIYIGGIGLARGYVRQPSLTAGSFVPDPWSFGGRLYKTGDLARYRPDGAIEFIGRMDGQVKIRGFRIELGEVEAALRSHPEVADAAVVARSHTSGDQLVAYVVPVSHASAPSTGDLLDYARLRLPEYMIPAHVVSLDHLPLSSNGKLDRHALPPPDSARPLLEHPLVEARGAIEEQVTAIWKEALDIEQVGVRDNFFELGGHSLLIAQVIARIRETFQVEVPMRSFFDDPTVEFLASAIKQGVAEVRPGWTPAGAAGSEALAGEQRP
jgi:amino acid adenylation domain-containing protein